MAKITFEQLAREQAEYESNSSWLKRERERRWDAEDAARATLSSEFRLALTDAVRAGMTQAYGQIARVLVGEAKRVGLQTTTGRNLVARAQGVGQLAGLIQAAAPPPKTRKDIHERVGYLARRSVSSSYGHRVTRNQSAMSRTGYRAGEGRLAGGVLRKALNKDEMVDAQADHLYFINWSMLDQEAAHWYRLNFGAGARGRNSRQGRYNMMFEGRQVLQVGLATGPSVNPVILPPGFFLNAEGGYQKRAASRRGLDAFFPGSHNPGSGRGRPLRARVTQGIEARNFLDAGVQRIARELPRAYDDFYRDALAQASKVSRADVDLSLKGFKNRVQVETKPSRAQSRFSRGVPLF